MTVDPETNEKNKKKAIVLERVGIEKSTTDPDEPNSTTRIFHTYDDEGTKIKTETSVTYNGGKNPPPDTKTINAQRYITLPNGEKYLAAEITASYEEDASGYPSKLVDSTMTTHSPTRFGQSHSVKVTSDGIGGEITGQNTGDDRVTPYAVRTSSKLLGTWEKKTESHTVDGIALYDSSFPVHGEAMLESITQDLKDLNHQIKETVNVTVYGLDHVINLKDKISFNGNEYFLVRNTARATPRIKSEQELTLVRWEANDNNG